jgi:RNA polymerase sigma-70 factor, ECF subfamily
MQPPKREAQLVGLSRFANHEERRSRRLHRARPYDGSDCHRGLIHAPGLPVVKSEERRDSASPIGAGLAPIHRHIDPARRPIEDQGADLVLIRRVTDRDESALAELYDRYAAQVNGLALSILRDLALAEETTHDVFLRVWEQPAGYDPTRGTFAGWLLRVSRNRAIDLLRRRRETSLDNAEADPMAWIADPAPNPEEQTISSLRRQEVHEALNALPVDQRQLLELAYFTGLTQREIAERLGRPHGTIKSQIRSAMRRLADRLTAAEAHASTERP